MVPVTYIFLGGKPYRLLKVDISMHACPCAVCALASECSDCRFMPLCRPDGYDDSWAFIEDWNIVDKKILDLLEFNIK